MTRTTSTAQETLDLLMNQVDSGGLEIWLVRHGETTWSASGRPHRMGRHRSLRSRSIPASRATQ